MKIAIIGSGAFGTALGGVLAENDYEVDYYDPLLEKPLTEVLEGAERMVLTVPSAVIETVLAELPKERPLVVATKGILGKEMFAEFDDVMALSGPGFADEIKSRRHICLTATDDRVAEMFTTDYLAFDQTRDMQGVLLCGALKNVYALLAGWMELSRETPEWQQFIAETTLEMQTVLVANGGEAATAELACGVGDLRLTCGLPSRNYEFGQMLKKNPQAQPDKTVEGFTALAKIKKGALTVPETAEKLKFLIEQSAKWG